MYNITEICSEFICISIFSSPTPPKAAEKDASLFDEDSNVEHLSKMNFDSFLAEHSSVLVMFYAPCMSF